MNLSRKLMLLAAASLLAIGAFAATGCGDDDDDDGGEPAATEPASTEPAGGETPSTGGKIDISGVPELADGKLTLGSDIAYAPIEFYDENNKAVGLDIDLANAMAAVLGVEVEFENAGFDTLLPALDAERYDAIMSSMTASEERKQTVDFVEYFNAGSGIIVAAGNPKGIASADDLCGQTVAVQKGTVQAEFLLGTAGAPGGKDKECKDAGKDGITVREFDTDPEAVQALVAGQADAEMADFPVAAYSAQQNEGKIEIVPNQIDPAPYGIAVRKSSTALRDVLQQALDAIKASGEYLEILGAWDLESGAN